MQPFLADFSFMKSQGKSEAKRTANVLKRVLDRRLSKIGERRVNLGRALWALYQRRAFVDSNFRRNKGAQLKSCPGRFRRYNCGPDTELPGVQNKPGLQGPGHGCGREFLKDLF